MRNTKLLAIFFALVMVLALTACGGNKNHNHGTHDHEECSEFPIISPHRTAVYF